jgi:hypothetical protein
MKLWKQKNVQTKVKKNHGEGFFFMEIFPKLSLFDDGPDDSPVEMVRRAFEWRGECVVMPRCSNPSLEVQRWHIIRQLYDILPLHPSYVEIELPDAMSDSDKKWLARALCVCFPERMDYLYDAGETPCEGCYACRPIEDPLDPPVSWMYRLRVTDEWDVEENELWSETASLNRKRSRV